MKLSLMALLIFTLLCSLVAGLQAVDVAMAQNQTQNADFWLIKAPMQQARSTLGVAVVYDKIYAIGGSTTSSFMPSIPPSAAYGNIDIGGFVGTNEEYDPASDTWVYKTAMPTPRIAFATAVYENKIYCIGGRTFSGDTIENQVYDPIDDSWATKASLPEANAFLEAIVVSDKIYVLTYSGKNYVYNPIADTWSTKASVPHSAFNGYAPAAFDDKIYVVGGLSSDRSGNLNMIYDTQTDSWSYGAAPPSSVGGGKAGVTTGALVLRRIFVLGEKANLKQGEESSFVRVYNPQNDSWSYGSDAPTDNRYNFGIAVLNDTFYVIGGHTYTYPGNVEPTSKNEQYTPMDYGIPDPSFQAPTPIQTQTPTSYTQSPQPSPTITPMLTPETTHPYTATPPKTPNASSPSPSPSPSPTIPEFPTWIIPSAFLIITSIIVLSIGKKKSKVG